MHAVRWILLLAVALSFAAGCDDDSTIVNRSQPEEGYPAATTPDQLVANFLKAYQERHYAEYEKLLHESFLFYLSQEDVAAGADVTFSRARDLEATYHMFSGEPAWNDQGTIIHAPIRAIHVTLMPEGPPWTDQVAQDFAGTLMRRYTVDMTMEFVAGAPAAVTGLQEFYAVAVPYDDGKGTETTVYQLKFWRDLGK